MIVDYFGDSSAKGAKLLIIRCLNCTFARLAVVARQLLIAFLNVGFIFSPQQSGTVIVFVLALARAKIRSST